MIDQAARLARQALFCLDEAGMGASPAACHLNGALKALGHEASERELEELSAMLFPSTLAA